MQEAFATLVDALAPLLRGGEVFTAHFSGERSDFVRFAAGAVRQAGAVQQCALSLDLIEGKRHAAGTLTLSGVPDDDRARLAALIAELRAMRGQLADDPFLLYATDGASTDQRHPATLPEPAAAVDAVQGIAAGRDLAGIYAAGAMHTGFASSFGQRNWHTSESFNLDWSFCHDADRAVKAAYAGTAWDSSELRRRADLAGEQLAGLTLAPRRVPPGRYRVYLSPAALWEVFAVLGWGGFSLRAHRTKTTPLLRMIEQGARLHPRLRLREHTAAGVAPNFQEAGFLRPDEVVLIEDGRYRDCLVSPRSAVEYEVPTNGAGSNEAPSSLDLAPGTLPAADVLAALGTGIYVSNLWYLNFSDRNACRTTGMTRFATFWVEGGRIAAPLEVMRFDETLYRMLGEHLVALTAEREMILDPGTYFQRSADSAHLPGALVDDFTLTL